MLKKIFLIIGSLIFVLFLGELLYFHSILTSSTPDTKTEAVIVFGGSRDRVAPGFKAAREHGARYLVISPASTQMLEAYGKEYPYGKAEYILEDKARTTFENAFYARQIIDDHDLKSIILVDSTYHMPRSFFLLRLILLGKGVRVQTLNTGGWGVDWNGWYRSGLGRKIVYNEMVKLWGSLGEMVLWKVRGKLPKQHPKRSAFIRKLRGWLLFDVHPQITAD